MTSTPNIDTSMRARQLASTVHQGRRVTFSIEDEDLVIGYIAGWDADTYFVVGEQASTVDGGDGIFKVLINKNKILIISMEDEKTFRDEPHYEEMNQIVQPFRNRINNDYFARK